MPFAAYRQAVAAELQTDVELWLFHGTEPWQQSSCPQSIRCLVMCGGFKENHGTPYFIMLDFRGIRSYENGQTGQLWEAFLHFIACRCLPWNCFAKTESSERKDAVDAVLDSGFRISHANLDVRHNRYGVGHDARDTGGRCLYSACTLDGKILHSICMYLHQLIAGLSHHPFKSPFVFQDES